MGGRLQVKGRVAVQWRIEENDGRIHNILIHGDLYISELPICLLCPQKWIQQANNNPPEKNGTWCGTYASACVLHWDQKKYKCTFTWYPYPNTGRLRSATGATTYQVFAATVNSTTQCDTHEHLAYRCVTFPSTGPHLIPDDEVDKETRLAPDPLISPQTNRISPVQSARLQS